MYWVTTLYTDGRTTVMGLPSPTAARELQNANLGRHDVQSVTIELY